MYRWGIETESERLCSSQYSAFSPSIRVNHLFLGYFIVSLLSCFVLPSFRTMKLPCRTILHYLPK